MKTKEEIIKEFELEEDRLYTQEQIVDIIKKVISNSDTSYHDSLIRNAAFESGYKKGIEDIADNINSVVTECSARSYYENKNFYRQDVTSNVGRDSIISSLRSY